MEPEEEKQSPHKIGLQEQDGTFTTLATLESESDSSFDNDDDDDGDDSDADFFLSQEFEFDLQFLESEASNDDEEIEEDDFDVDELTYEEFIELGDFIGKKKRGLSAIEISSCLHSYTCHSAENKSGIGLCVICQVDYEDGEDLVALPCEHPYHTDCISKWLQIKKVCPICSSEISVPKMVNKNP